MWLQHQKVYHVLNAMDATGVDVFVDVHGDEALPVAFCAGAEGLRVWGPRHKALVTRHAHRRTARRKLLILQTATALHASKRRDPTHAFGGFWSFSFGFSPSHPPRHLYHPPPYPVHHPT